MALVEEEMINERDLSISKDSVEKSNSLVIKSLDEGAFNFVDLIKDKLVLLITTKNKINYVRTIRSKRIRAGRCTVFG